MKKLILLIILGFLVVLCSFKGNSQTNYIIIGSGSDSIYVNSLNAHLEPATWYNYYYYYLDLDWNGIPDFRFSTTAYMGGSATNGRISLSSGDNSFFSVEKVITDIGYYGGPYGNDCFQTTDSVKIPRIYNGSDTIRQIDCNTSSTQIVTYFDYLGGQWPCTIHNVDNWISGIHFIGIKKRINNIDYLGWIKVHVTSDQAMDIIEYAMNNSIVNVAEYGYAEDLFYPNPVGSELVVRDRECRRIEMYNTFGELVTAADHKTGEPEFKINVGNLSPGMYIVKIYSKDRSVTRKVIKI